jgi:hypothetical protein
MAVPDGIPDGTVLWALMISNLRRTPGRRRGAIADTVGAVVDEAAREVANTLSRSANPVSRSESSGPSKA